MLGYDYSQDNLYFVTICVKDMVCTFGNVENQQMILNDYGEIVKKQWFWLADQYSYINLHAFVVMPNHIHGIVEIKRNNAVIENQKIKSLSQIIGALKTTASKQIHLSGKPNFVWHRSFHDHIIRSEEAFEKISNYIENNPMKWKGDKFSVSA
jgi:REP element-mobilizing transposase RayT